MWPPTPDGDGRVGISDPPWPLKPKEQPPMFTRRQALFAATLAATGLSAIGAARSRPSGKFAGLRFAVISDTHITDEFYHGDEGPDPFDRESIGRVRERLLAVRETLNGLSLDLVLVGGDLFHNYPSPDESFYADHRTRLDEAKALFDGFSAPVHVVFGNHDYGVPEISREMSHRLFKAKFGVEPYHAVDVKGVRFLMLNNMLGATWDPANALYNKGLGSFGETQLCWLDEQLSSASVAFIVLHFPMPLVLDGEEAPGLGFYGLLRRHQAKIARVFGGHWHRWVDFGNTFGPPHTLVAATRYSANNYLIVDANPGTGAHRFANADYIDWGTRFARPFNSSARL
ncbi:MAG: metallophosphoesterase family protein [Rhizomicrobium sp.]